MPAGAGSIEPSVGDRSSSNIAEILRDTVDEKAPADNTVIVGPVCDEAEHVSHVPDLEKEKREESTNEDALRIISVKQDSNLPNDGWLLVSNSK